MARKKEVQSRVRWNDDEKRALIDAGKALLMKEPTAKLLLLIEKAQSVLPAARRRTITQIGQAAWFVAAVRSGKMPKAAKVSKATGSKATRSAATPSMGFSPAASVAGAEEIATRVKDMLVDALAGLFAGALARAGLGGAGVKSTGTGKRRGRPPGSKSKRAAKRKA